jgi:membrane protein DedA with SNARE-associated domain
MTYRPELLLTASLLSLPLDILRWLIDLPAKLFGAYSWLLETAVEAVHNLFEDYGYWVIFLGTLFENTLLLGLIVPGVIVILLAGVNAENGVISPPIAFVLGVLGTAIGDTLSYWAGRLGWTRVQPGGSVHAFTERVREPILRRGPLFVLVYHFAGYTRLFGPAAAGLLRMPYRQWAPADYLGAMVWVGFYLGAGYALGLAGFSLDSSEKWFRAFEWGLLAVIAVWVIVLLRSGQAGWLRLFLDWLFDVKREPEPAAETTSEKE